MTENPEIQPQQLQQHQSPVRKISFRIVLLWLAIGIAALWLLAVLMIVAAKWIDPPTTAVQMQRRFQSWFHNAP